MSTDGNGFEVCEVATTDAPATPAVAGLLVVQLAAAMAAASEACSEADIVCMKI